MNDWSARLLKRKLRLQMRSVERLTLAAMWGLRGIGPTDTHDNDYYTLLQSLNGVLINLQRYRVKRGLIAPEQLAEEVRRVAGGRLV